MENVAMGPLPKSIILQKCSTKNKVFEFITENGILPMLATFFILWFRLSVDFAVYWLISKFLLIVSPFNSNIL